MLNVATRRVVVANRNGLHTRPSLAIVNAVAPYQASVEIRHASRVADARSILDLMLLAAPFETELVLTATGPQAEQALSAVADVFAQSGDA